MADYYQLKNQNIFNPPANTSLGNTSNQFANAFVQNDLILGNVTVTGSTINTPKVSTIGYPGNDTAADTAGGQTITLTGSGFLAGASVLINGSAVSVVTVVSTTSITFTSPANNTGSYVLYVINTDGGTAIAIPGIQYSGVPTWTTAAGSLGSVYETASFNQTVTATGDAPITYSLFSGSIPPGSTFNSNGTITGTSQVLSSPTTYTFTVRATDAEAQDTNRSFSLTITPDVVTWVSPANGTTYTTAINSAISNVVLSATSAVGSGITYTANALPTGLSLAGANISGTPTVEANSSSLLTATANTTSELSSITINWVISVANDVYFEYNTLLIPGASTTFVDDASTNNFAVTIFGDTKPNNSNPYTPGYYSNYFDGTGDYISVPDNVVFTMGAGDFTLEAWVYLTTSGVSRVIIGTCDAGGSQGSMSYTLSVNASNNAYFAVGYGGAMYGSTNTTTILTNQWVHIAGVRSGANIYVYLNGVQSTSNTNMGALAITDSSQIIGIGRNGAYNGEYVTGYISNTRIVKGLAVYTGAFTVPTSPLQATQSSGTNIAAITGTSTSLLTCQSNRFIDNSTTPFTVTVGGDTKIQSFQPFVPNSSYSTYGSGYFDGTGDYLQTPSNAAFNFSATDCTLEFWYYGAGSGGLVFEFGSSTPDTAAMQCEFSSGTLTFKPIGASSSFFAIQPNAWNYIAAVKTGTTYYLYINGTRNTTSTGTAASSGQIINIGARNGGSVAPITGYLSDFRVSNTARYTGATMTVPSAPLTAIANTSLLVLQNNQSVNNSVFLDNSTNNFFVTRNGNTTQGTFSPYGGNWSNYFDGTGDYLTVPANAALVFVTGDFTIELWFYIPGGITSPLAIIGNGTGSIDNAYWSLEGIAGGNIAFFGPNSATQYFATTTQPWTSGWAHIAVSRSGANTKLFLNGVQQGSTYTTNNSFTTGGSLYIGTSSYSPGSRMMPAGYISNVRVLKGTALYTTTFTPSTTPLTPVTNTSLLTSQSNRLIDNSANAFAITKVGDVSVQRFSPFNPVTQTPISYSGYFDGSWANVNSGDYLTLNGQSNFAFGSNNFTVEMWVYATSFSAAVVLYDSRPGSTSGVYGVLYYDTTGLYWNINNQTISGTAITLNTWNHLAVSRSGTTTKLFINGTQVGTATDTNSYLNGALAPVIGGQGYSRGSNCMQGYISNVRVVNGTAVYTANFTPSTTPLTAITNTQLLTCQSSTFVDNSTNAFAITAVNEPKLSTYNPFGFTNALTTGYSASVNGGSGYFDGSGDYLNTPTSGQFAPTGDFTVSFWYYPTTLNTYNTTIGNYTQVASTDWFIEFTSDGSANVYTNGSTVRIIGGAGTIKSNQWSFVTLSRLGTTITFKVNGTSVGTYTQSGTFGSSTKTIQIGRYYSGTEYITGYLSDVRLIDGSEVTTIPTSPLTAVSGTNLLLNFTNAGIYDAAMMTTMETVGDAKLSTAVSKFGGSSMSFDGTGDYLTTPATTNLSFGTGDFTVEAWVYLTTNSATGVVAYLTDFRANGSTNNFAIGFMGTSGVSKMYAWANATDLNGTTTVALNTWNHVAYVRSGSIVTAYLNGTANGTMSNAYSQPSTGVAIGARYTGASEYVTGYIDDLRITKGYARYTSNFSVPTSAFPIF